MGDRERSGGGTRLSLVGFAKASTALVLAVLTALAIGAAPASAQDEDKRVMLYTGTTGFRHADAINSGRQVIQNALQAEGYTVDWEDCDNNGGGANNCDNPAKNPRIFTDENLAQYDAILLFNASASWAGGGRPGPLWNAAQRAAIIRFVQAGGGIAANHNATDMGAGVVSWDWWDGGNDSAVGSLMKGHAATNVNNVAQVEVADHHHLSTRDLPDTYGFGDEHYNFARSVRGTHHVLATLDERTYNPANPMGYDHPISWCKLYDGDNVADGTGTPKPYNDGRVWLSGMGHFGSSYTANGGDNNLIKQIVGGVRWVAGEGKKSDCSGTVWSNYQRTTLVSDVNGPIALDVAPDGKVYWTEIGPSQGFNSEGYVKVHDPAGPANNKATVAAIPTRADHGNSEDGVLGMSLEPDFDLSDPEQRDIYVYYSPRPGAGDSWPTTGSQQTVGYNQISRFTLDAAGTGIVAGSERVILRVPKAKISGSPSGFPGGPTDSGPGHVGGAGLVFDSEGNLYLGVGDDVSPNASGHNGYPPLDYRAAERWDARNTSANSADLRGKVLRIAPAEDIPAGTDPGAGATYTIPAGNMFEPGTPQTRPEIYAMGFRQPFTIHTDPANPGTVAVGEYCHDNSSNGANRAPAGTCEWDLIDSPGFEGWPFCVGDNSAANTSWRWNYAGNTSTGSQYDCSLADLPSDLDWAPAGQTAAQPTFDGLDTLPGPARAATIWRKYPGAAGGQSTADFGDLSAGGMQPITGPIYRHDADSAQPGAFPPYYDGSWLIANRGADNGFWKEVRLRSDDNEMLKVNDWLPTSQFGSPNNSFVIPTRFGPDGALYMARWSFGCCRNQLSAGSQTQLVKIESTVQDECLEDTQAPNTSHQLQGQEHPDEPGTYIDSATLTLIAGDAGCAGVDTIEYRVDSDDEEDWQAYDDPVRFDEPGSYTVDYRATDRFENVSEVEQATFTVVHIDDQDPPAVTATLSGSQTADGHYLSPASLTIEASDQFSAITSIEYRVNQADDWTKEDFDGENLTEELQQQFADTGFHFVEFRATDSAGNTSAIDDVRFSVVGECEYLRSDEFGGSALDSRWLRHTRNGGTPTEGSFAPTLANGQLTLPTHNFEIDAASATTSVGPINFIGQDLPALGDSWEVETQFTVEHTGGWQGTGLMLWRADNNFFRSTITHNLGSGVIYVEQSKDNPTSAEGSRQQSSGNPTIVGSKQPVTIRMRYARTGGSNTVSSQYRIIAPASAATPDWVNFPTIPGGLDLNPSSGPRRDSEGSRIGLYAGGNFPGTTGNNPYPGTPAQMVVDYFRVTPDEAVSCPDDDVVPPETTAALDPADPGAGGTYDGPVEVTLSATDGDDENASGVEATEYRVDGGAWQESENGGGDDPFTSSLTVSGEGEHAVDYRSRDVAGNLEVAQRVELTIEAPAPTGNDVYAVGTDWDPDHLDIPFGDTVTWHFDQPDARFPHDVWLAPPDGDQSPTGGDLFEVTDGPVPAGGDPVDYTFRSGGTWTYICRLHASFDSGSGTWAGMVGTVAVGEDPGGDPGAPTVQGFADPTSGPAPLRVRFSATGLDPDGGPLRYRWDFENGAVLGASATHTFTEPGVHMATVTVTDDEGKTASDTVMVTVTDPGSDNQPPTVEASVDEPTGPAPHRVRLDATGNDPDGPNNQLVYYWDFGDGGADSFARRPSHTYREPGVYTATVTVSDPGGASASAEVEVTVTDPPGNLPPSVEAAALPTSGPAPLSTLLTAQGTDPDGDRLSYSWALGDGQSADGRRVRHVYLLPGTYNAEVTATDEAGATATATVQIVVGNPPGNQAPTVQVAADPRSGTAPLRVRLTSASSDPDGDPLMHVWDLGDGVKAGGPHVTHTYTQPGVYTATLTVTDRHGASGSAQVQVTVNAPGQQQQQQGVRQGAGDGTTGGGVAGDEAAAPARGQKVRRLVRRGLRYTVSCATDCRVSSRLKVSRKQARKLGLSRKARRTGRIGRAAARTIRAGESRAVVVKLDRAVRRQLRRAMRRAGVERLRAKVVTVIRSEEGLERQRSRIVLRR